MSPAMICSTLRRLALCSAVLICPLARPAPAPLPPVRDDMAQRMLACMACHGQQPASAKPGFFPRIAGKPAGYLYNQLINFRDGRRRYPVMNSLLANLSDDYLREMAVHFSELHLPYPAPRTGNTPAADLERGQRLAMRGDPARQIPACAACHGAALSGAAPAIPGLLGLPRDYLNAQFGAWKTGARRATAPDCMHQIGARLTADDIQAITGWLAGQAVPAGPVPAAPPGRTLPALCGSVPQ